MEKVDRMNMKHHYGDYKTILSPQNGMNIYRGCSHGCIYCDSRSKCYEMNHDFEDIEVKRNAPEILEQELCRKRKKAMIGTGSMCDPYIPPERELKYTRRCLEAIEKHGFGLSILTKSDLILRDLDLLTAINEKAKCVVQMTLTTFDDDLCKKIEPNVSLTSERAATLKTISEAGIPTAVWLCPILPFINDTMENLEGILSYCKEANVKAIVDFGFGVTLREGSRDYFFPKLDERFPGMAEKYGKTFGNSYECPSPDNSRLYRRFAEFCRENNIMYDLKNIFNYLWEYKEKEEEEQLSFNLFDL